MGQPYVGEIRMFGGNFAPAGWMTTDGQILPISEYETLFNLIGTTYGGDGQSTFALPNLAGRTPMHMGTSSFGTTRALSEIGGATNTAPEPLQTTNKLAGSGYSVNVSPVNTQMPFLAITFIISLFGIYPSPT
jgi:microcystin-dependent protein